MSLPVSEDVYEDIAQFHGTVRDILGSLDVDSSAMRFETGVNLAIKAIGRDPVKLLALFDELHEHIARRWNWATGPAVKFYRLLFSGMDMSILEDSDFEAQAKDGITRAVEHIVRKCTIELDQHDDWNSARVRCTTDFVLKAFEGGNNVIAAHATASFLLNMIESWNILVNSTNITIFVDILRNTVPKIQLFGLQDVLDAVSERVRELPNQMQLCDAQLETITIVLEELSQASQAKNVASNASEVIMLPIQADRGLDVFKEELDWTCEEIGRLVGRVSERMKTGAPLEIRKEAGAIVKAMLDSNNVFVLDDNLMILVSFLEHIGPIVDAANEGESLPLTAALKKLSDEGKGQTAAQIKAIRDLRRALGR